MAVTDAPVYVYTREERAAYALSGVFKVLACLAAVASFLLALLLTVDVAGLLLFTSLGLLVAAFLLFLSYVLMLLAGIHARLGAAGRSSIS